MNDNYLAHHGVKGMKWGVRHDRREGRLYRARNHMRNLTGSRSSDALKEARKKTSIRCPIVSCKRLLTG